MENSKTGRIAYSYTPEDWSQEEFLRLGGFTVVCLNYNQLKYIEKSVAAALAQDFPRLEMFFMDNASTDGSGDLLEKLVRPYRGRHKVTVVRNEVNVYITGQWNIVSKLATGNWLGMFCGDDISHPDRVSLVAERIRKYPTLRGISTAAVDIDVATGLPLPDSHYVPAPYFANGTDSWEELSANFKSNGSTSFWHKSLFADSIPFVPLDDNYLHFRVFVLNHGVNGPIFLYDSSIKTIDYSVGVGICGGGIKGGNGDSPQRKWVVEISRYKVFLKKLVRTMRKALAYGGEKGLAEPDLSPFKCTLWWNRMRSANTLGRLLLVVPYLAFLVGARVSCARKRSMVRDFFYYLFLEFLGLSVASWIRSLR